MNARYPELDSSTVSISVDKTNLSEVQVNESIKILTTETLSEITLEDIRKTVEFFIHQGKTEGVFVEDKKPEFVFILKGPKGGFSSENFVQQHGGIAVASGRTNEIFAYIDPEKMKQNEWRLDFIQMIFHELRHRVSKRTYLETKSSAPSYSGERTVAFPLTRLTHASRSVPQIEEIFTVGFVAEHFEHFLAENMPSLVDTYNMFEHKGMTYVTDELGYNFPNPIQGLGTLTYPEISTNSEGKEQLDYFPTRYFVYIPIYRALKEQLGEQYFDTLLTRIRQADKVAITELIKKLQNMYGLEFTKKLNLLNVRDTETIVRIMTYMGIEF